MGHERRLLQQTAVGRFPLWSFGDRGGGAVQYVLKGHKRSLASLLNHLVGAEHERRRNF
jgi:hypothetical protein